MFKNLYPRIEAVAVVAGTIIGAGVLGVPYAVAELGVVLSAVVLLLVGGMLAILMLFLSEVSLQTNGRQQLTGYAASYLGPHAKHILATALVVNIFGALLAYMIGQGSVLSSLLGGTPVVWSLVFLCVFGILIVLGINVIKHVEVLLTGLILVMLGAVVAISVPHVTVEHVLTTGTLSLSGVLVMYGVALFACFGLTAVPQVRTILRDESAQTYRSIILIGTLVPPVLYIFFAAVIVGVTGADTTPVATVALGEWLGTGALLLGSLFAFFAMATSFLALGLALRNVFHHDYGLSRRTASSLVLGVPLLLFLSGVRDFITVLSIVGAFALGIVGVVGIMVYLAARESSPDSKNVIVSYGFGTVSSGILITMFILSMMLVLFDLLYPL